MNHLYILGCIIFTVFGQLLAKWRMSFHSEDVPVNFGEKLYFYIFTLLLDPYIIISYLSALIGSFFWLIAVSKFELSYAYPFMSLAFVFVFILSAIIFNESFNYYKIFGSSCIIIGLIIMSRGYK